MTSLDRRRFLVRTLQAGGLMLSASALAACGDDKDSADSSGATGAGGGRFGKLDFRFAWLKNVEFADSYLADTRGYFREEGFGEVDFIAGGPSAPPIETDVVTGKAFVGLSSPDRVAAAVKEGAKIVIVGSQYQKNPFALMSMANKPINSPQEMIGRKIGVSAANEAVWQAFLKANDIPESKITKVPVQFDPLPLTTGSVDGWMCYVTNEPTVLRLKGHNVSTFLFADFNYPIVGETYIVTRETLAKNPDKVMAVLRAEIRGWKDSLADPAAGAKLAVENYGKGLGLNLEEQVTESGDQNKLILTDDTKRQGIFTMTPALVEANVKALKFAGSEVTAEELFDLSLIDRIYKENPQLV